MFTFVVPIIVKVGGFVRVGVGIVLLLLSLFFPEGPCHKKGADLVFNGWKILTDEKDNYYSTT